MEQYKKEQKTVGARLGTSWVPYEEGFRVQGLGFRVSRFQCFGFRVKVSGFR